MRVIVLDGEKVQGRNIKDELDTFYKIIGCDYIDIVTRKIGNKYYDLIIDDEGAINGSEPRMMEENCQEVLFGNIIICGEADPEGNLTSLTDEDLRNIISHLMFKGLTYRF